TDHASSRPEPENKSRDRRCGAGARGESRILIDSARLRARMGYPGFRLITCVATRCFSIDAHGNEGGSNMTRQTTTQRKSRTLTRALAALAVVLGAGLVSAAPARADHDGPDVGFHFFFGLPFPPVPMFP